MPTLNLNVLSAKLYASAGRMLMAEDGIWRLSLTVEDADRLMDGLVLTSGEQTREMEMFVNFSAETPDKAEWVQRLNKDPEGKLVGLLHYFDNKPAILGDVFVPEAVMDRLIGFAQQGLYPSTLSLELQGVEYAFEHGGAGVKWDTTANRQIGIYGAAFTMPLDRNLPADYEDTAPKTPVGLDLLPTLKGIAKYQQWTFGALVVALISYVISR